MLSILNADRDEQADARRARGRGHVVLMSGSRSLTPLIASEYDLIESAMAETERGRWFLAEYARRNRTADTEMLLGAIGRLESVVTGEREAQGFRDAGFGRLRGDLMEMAEAIARTRAEIAAIAAPDQESRLTVASETLDAIVRATERATSDILGAAEEVQEAAWTLRETGADGALCDSLDRHATQIYTACSFQDLTAQRTGRIVHTLRYLEDRLASMIAIWGERIEDIPRAPVAETGAAAPTPDLDQSDVDRFLDMETSAVPNPVARPPLEGAPSLADDLAFLPERAEPDVAEEGIAGTERPVFEIKASRPEAAPVPSPPLSDAFADLDRLSIEEKIALFS